MERKFIMLVDDDADLATLFEYAAKIEDMIILILQGGFSALKTLASLNYEVDAVILDLSMPDIDGINLTEQIRNNESIRSRSVPLPIFWQTGWPVNETIENARKRYGVQEIFVKPVNAVDVVHRVKQLLSGGKYRTRNGEA